METTNYFKIDRYGNWTTVSPEWVIAWYENTNDDHVSFMPCRGANPEMEVRKYVSIFKRATKAIVAEDGGDFVTTFLEYMGNDMRAVMLAGVRDRFADEGNKSAYKELALLFAELSAITLPILTRWSLQWVSVTEGRDILKKKILNGTIGGGISMIALESVCIDSHNNNS